MNDKTYMKELLQEIQSYKQEKRYYLEKIDNDRKRLNELQTNNENLEKFAREQYLMKKPDEEIFIVSPE